MPTTFDQLATTIRERFSAMSPQFQAAASLLDNPDEVAVLSMRKLAERANGQTELPFIE